MTRQDGCVDERVPFSVLDLCPVPTGVPTAEALRRSVDLARHVESWGYRRFWVAEHHNMPGVASSAPAVLVGQVAAATSVIRVGSGGVMLPNHVPLVVAEQFGMLEALHPGRIDLGIGRAPGTDHLTARALRRNIRAVSDEDFPQQLMELQGYFADPSVGGTGQPRPRAIPAEGNEPALWLLGSSGYSAQMAGLLGLPFAFAHHFSAANTLPALALYRRTFRPSAVLAEPYCLVSVAVVCAPGPEQAAWLHGSSRLSILRLRTGHPSTLPSPEEAAEYLYTDAERAVVAESTVSHLVGDPATVVAQLDELRQRTGADELMITTSTYSHEDRLRSYELLAESAGLGPTADSSEASVARRRPGPGATGAPRWRDS
ncbi:MAG TPA: LLM class flavin-dependent oxidoreductase [Acidimicrobiales bacterium]|nr:LLM class flavin-dependent oxidoreductase [Acidimicrobiales bacterium]